MTNRKIHETTPNATVGMEAVEERQILPSCKKLKYLKMCIKAHEALTEALAEVKARSEQTEME